MAIQQRDLDNNNSFRRVEFGTSGRLILPDYVLLKRTDIAIGRKKFEICFGASAQLQYYAIPQTTVVDHNGYTTNGRSGETNRKDSVTQTAADVCCLARGSGASIDTTRNTEYTDWNALDQTVEAWSGEFENTAPDCAAPNENQASSQYKDP